MELGEVSFDTKTKRDFTNLKLTLIPSWGILEPLQRLLLQLTFIDKYVNVT